MACRQDEDVDAVAKWKGIAAALHDGALDHCGTFKSTDEAITYLCGYHQGQRQTVVSSSTTQKTHKHHDFYYHPENIPGSLGLGSFFTDAAFDYCLMCKHIRMEIVNGRFQYMNLSAAPVVTTTEPCDEMNLRRLEHLAVMHTPYFALLFLELVENKRYGFHQNHSARHSMAKYVFEQLSHNGSTFTSGRDDPYTFLRLWWRVQDKRGSRDLKVTIPLYVQLHNGTTTWNPRLDTFAVRKPEPLYTFLTKQCLCHEIWPKDSAFTTPDDDTLTCKVTTVPKGQNVSTFSLRVPIPKVHVEDTLHSTVRTCIARSYSQVCGTVVSCSNTLEPRLDCVILEDGHARAVMMHIVTTLDSQWQPLTCWLSSKRGTDTTSELESYYVNKVFLGVMGSLRDMCLSNKRPPRQLYSETEHGEPKLATAFFVHSETHEVLSLLPFVSLSRMYRSSSVATDEVTFRLACTDLALCMLYAGLRHDRIMSVQREMTKWWETIGSISDDGPSEDKDRRKRLSFYVCRFCRTGLVNDNTWSTLKPKEVSSREPSAVSASSRVYLGKDSREDEALRHKLLALGVQRPLHVSVIEHLTDGEAFGLRYHQGCTTPAPETYHGLLSAMTIEKRTTPSWSQVFRVNISSRSYVGCHHRKRTNSIVPETETTTAKALKHLREMSSMVENDITKVIPTYPVASTSSAAPKMYLDATRQLQQHKSTAFSKPKCDVDPAVSSSVGFRTDLCFSTRTAPLVYEGGPMSPQSTPANAFLINSNVDSRGFSTSDEQSDTAHPDTEPNTRSQSQIARTPRTPANVFLIKDEVESRRFDDSRVQSDTGCPEDEPTDSQIASCLVNIFRSQYKCNTSTLEEMVETGLRSEIRNDFGLSQPQHHQLQRPQQRRKQQQPQKQPQKQQQQHRQQPQLQQQQQPPQQEE